MHSALLALYAVCSLPVVLQPQSYLAEASWPTHAVAALPRGYVQKGEQFYLLENGRPIVTQVETASTWPDGSPKWVHAYASFRYRGGQPAKYELVKLPQPPADMPASPLKVSDTPDGIHIDTGSISLLIPRPFAGVTQVESNGKRVIDGPGGPSLIDERGLVWQAVDDDKAEVVIEQQGPAQVTVRATGWYQTAARRVERFCRFTTRITACANSPVIKFDHATIFADDMRKHAIAELSFRFTVPGVRHVSSGTTGARLSGESNAAWFAQLTADRLVTLKQPGADGAAYSVAKDVEGRSPGWFCSDVGNGRVVLLTKDFWQKFPKEVKLGQDEIVYYAWPAHGELSPPDPAATRLERIYKFECFATGKLLDSRLPNDYFAALLAQKDTTECQATFARAANLAGVAMHNEFALVFLPPASTSAAEARYLTSLEQLYAFAPVAIASRESIAESGAFGPVAPRGSNFAEVDDAMRDGTLGYGRSIERYGDYGWHIYGNTHSDELMNPAAAGVAGGRPTLHRVWINAHYQHVSAAWMLWALDGDRRLLDWARTCTDNYASIGQVHYDPMHGRYDGNGNHEVVPDIMFHSPGAFWHCKGLVPWGARDYGMPKDDLDAALYGHWIDPTGLLYAWLLDGNRWARDGYELWLDRVKLPTGGTRREINTTLVHAINAYEYQPKPETLEAIRGMVHGLMSEPVREQRPGGIFEPTWLSRYHELVPDDKGFNKFIVESADAVGLAMEGTWSLALSATAYDLTKNEAYLRRHAGTLERIVRRVFHDSAPDKRWDGYGLGPEDDGRFIGQWHRFKYALRQAGVESLPAPEEPGNYWCGNCRYDHPGDIAARGIKILIWGASGAPQIELAACSIGRGGIHGSSLHVLSPKRQSLLDVARLPMSGGPGNFKTVMRPSSWEVSSESYPLPVGKPGLYSVLVGSDAIGIFQPLTSYPECQVLRSSRRPGLERGFLVATLSRGYLVPLAPAKIHLTFTAMGSSDSSYVALADATGKKFLERWVRAGDTVSATLNEAGGPPSPWSLDVFADGTGYTKLTIESVVAEPLLFGRRLEDVELIREKLRAR